jgi:hypothetical protein
LAALNARSSGSDNPRSAKETSVTGKTNPNGRPT